jgi:hypothetical protein
VNSTATETVKQVIDLAAKGEPIAHPAAGATHRAEPQPRQTSRRASLPPPIEVTANSVPMWPERFRGKIADAQEAL